MNTLSYRIFIALLVSVLFFIAVGFSIVNARIDNPPLPGMTGPGSSTDNAVVRFDGTGGSTVQNSGVLINDSNLVSLIGGFISSASSSVNTLQGRSLFASSTIIADGLIVGANVNALIGGAFQINGTSVLNATTLGSAVVNSSLTSLGTIANFVATNASTTRLTSSDYTSLGTGAGLVGIGSTTPRAKLSVNGNILNQPQQLTDGATITIDMSLGNVFFVTLAGNRTIAFSNIEIGQSVRVYVTQDSTGSRTLAYPISVHFKGGAPTLSTGVGETDVLNFSTATSAQTIHGTYAIN